MLSQKGELLRIEALRQLRGATDLFERCDTDGSGTISSEEFERAADRLSSVRRALESVAFQDVDVNRDGELQFTEFLHLLETAEGRLRRRK